MDGPDFASMRDDDGNAVDLLAYRRHIECLLQYARGEHLARQPIGGHPAVLDERQPMIAAGRRREVTFGRPRKATEVDRIAAVHYPHYWDRARTGMARRAENSGTP